MKYNRELDGIIRQEIRALSRIVQLDDERKRRREQEEERERERKIDEKRIPSVICGVERESKKQYIQNQRDHKIGLLKHTANMNERCFNGN